MRAFSRTQRIVLPALFVYAEETIQIAPPLHREVALIISPIIVKRLQPLLYVLLMPIKIDQHALW